jgi:signal transduction histidine kinase
VAVPEDSFAFDGPAPAMQRLAAASLSISSHLELAAVLRELVDAAAELAGARYAAVGVFAEDRRTLREFITVGLSDEEIAGIGSLPTGRGVLGTLVHHAEPLRIPDVTRHPDSVGFPPGHPPMRSFLGVSIRAGGEVFGRIYLTEKRGGGEFTAEDEGLVSLVAAHAGVAVENARLYEMAFAAERRTRLLFEVAGGGPLHEIVTAASERVLQLQKAAAAVVLWGVDGSLDVIAAVGDGEVPEGLSRPADLPGFEWVPITGDEERHGWLGVRLSGGDELTPERREQLEGWAGVISLAHRAERLRLLRRQVLVAEERSRIAMELHDGAVQRLFGVGMALQGASQRAGDGDTRLVAALASAVDEIDSAISEIRAYVHDLRPSGLEPATVRQLIADDVGMLAASGVTTDLHLDDAVLAAIGGDVSAELVQVLAEACANMARYAHASHAEIRVERRRGRVAVSVSDDGVGFDPAAHSTGHGLKNLRERAARLDGELHIDSAPGKGTRLRLEVPL